MSRSTPAPVSEHQKGSSARAVEELLLARWPETKLQPSLDRIRMLVGMLGQPQRTYPSIHLTGTNGKTSTARMVEALLIELGNRVGRFTSPHLLDIRERITLDGRPIDEAHFVETYEAVAAQALQVDASCEHPLSFFEMTVAMAYEAFATYEVDAAVVEVGMGGRWDATNVVDGRVAAILPIGLDHTDYLGSTRLDIAAEKAGVIKPGALAVTARQDPQVEQLLRAHADATLARLLVEDRDFALTRRRTVSVGQVITVSGLAARYDDVPLALHGRHQAHNAAVAIACVEALLEDALPRDAVYRALGRVKSPGRLDVLPGKPTVVLDAAHNPDGALALASALSDLGSGHTVGVVAVMADKDYSGVLTALEPVVDVLVCTQNATARSLSAGELADCARAIFGTERVLLVEDLAGALDEAARVAAAAPGSESDPTRVLVTGSVVTIAQAMALLGR
jgi:dihydrofolate synthase/folylpolyglutamate synthase